MLQSVGNRFARTAAFTRTGIPFRTTSVRINIFEVFSISPAAYQELFSFSKLLVFHLFCMLEILLSEILTAK
jgi:hypothetical protein